MISVDGGHSFTPIWEASEPEKQWTKTRINLDAFAGQTIQIAFRYEKYDAPDAHTWFIDDIEVKLAQLSPPETATMSVFNISASSATVTGMLVDPGDSPVTDRGIVWSTNTGPTLENHLGIMHAEQGNDIFTIQLAGLTEQTTYYARTWATNQQGTGYGNEIVFTAQFTPFVCGESTVSDIEGNEYTTVEIGNQCWLGENLKTTRYRNELEINNPNCIVNFMNNEWGVDNEGAYLSWNNDDQYRIRYGAIYNLHAVLNENKLCPAGWHVPHDFDDVESEITRKGLVWSKTANPDIENNQGMIELGSGTDNFYHTLDSLTPRTAYYIKAFAENSLGITYGNEVNFYTLGPAIPCPGEETVTDADGKIYTTIRIGSQYWLA